MTGYSYDSDADVHTITGWVNISNELQRDIDEAKDAIRAHLREAGLDFVHGHHTRHHPDASDLWKIQRPERVRANIRRNLDDQGWTKKPGTWVPTKLSTTLAEQLHDQPTTRTTR